MFIKRTTSKHGDKTYINHLLVESVTTPAGPRHKVICNLGKLDPGPKEEWLELADRIQAALGGQPSLFPDHRVDETVQRVRLHRAKQAAQAKATTQDKSKSDVGEAVPELVSVKPSGVQIRDVREVGPLHVCHAMWQRLQADAVLKAAGLTAPMRLLTEVMTLNRLIHPCSELAMVDWTKRAAIADVLGMDVEKLNEDRLYRNLDALHGKRVVIETELHSREKTLFDLDGQLVLYDLTNTYFEGQVKATPKAKRGVSKEKRSDCKLVAMGLMVDGDGFPIGHEVLDGSTNDGTTVGAMLDALERRTGRKGGSTVVMDRGFASEDNRKLVVGRQYDYLVAGFQNQRGGLLDEFENLEGWVEIEPSVISTPVQIKRIVKDQETFLLCISAARAEKDRAIRERQEKGLATELAKLAASLEKPRQKGKSPTDSELGERIGRLRERYSRVGRYFIIERKDGVLVWAKDEAKLEKARDLDGAYFLRTSRMDMDAEAVWRTYISLTRIESAFRDLKGTLDMRPIYHRKEMRVETHIFLCVLAFHLQAAIERTLREAGDHTSWETLRQQLSTHQIATVTMPTADGRTLAIRRASIPEQRPREIYRLLGINGEPMDPIRTWV